jgi:DNA repair exonuclease SbcCD nuclease subunit
MKVIVIGDIHIKRKNHERSVLLVNHIIQTVKERRPDFVVLLGDVLDGADIVHSECLLLLTKLLRCFEKLSVQCYLITGNHDMSTPHVALPENHALQCFKGFPFVTVVDSPISLNNGISMIPYLPNGEFLGNLPDKSSLVFCHQEFFGCFYEDGRKSEKGDRIPEGVEIISGHIHKAQKIGNLWYPGTPTQTRFGEDEDKAYYEIVLKYDNGNYSSYDLIDRIIPDVPRFVSYKYEIGSGVKSLTIDKSCVNRAVVSATPSEIISLKKSKEYSILLETFNGGVKFNVQKEERVITESKTRMVSFLECLSEKAKELGLQELLNSVMK